MLIHAAINTVTVEKYKIIKILKKWKKNKILKMSTTRFNIVRFKLVSLSIVLSSE